MNSYETACILKEKNSEVQKREAQVGGNLYNWYENFSDTYKKRWMVNTIFFMYHPEKNPENEILYELIRSILLSHELADALLLRR